jgi:hypothetical protein
LRGLSSIKHAQKSSLTLWPDHSPSGNQSDSGAILRSGKRFVMLTHEKLTAFLELESAIRPCGELA